MLLNGKDQLVPRLWFQQIKTEQTEKEFSAKSRFVCEGPSRKGDPWILKNTDREKIATASAAS